MKNGTLLLSYDFIWLFPNISGAHSQSGRNRLPYYANSQKIRLTIRGSLQVNNFQKISFVQHFIENINFTGYSSIYSLCHNDVASYLFSGSHDNLKNWVPSMVPRFNDFQNGWLKKTPVHQFPFFSTKISGIGPWMLWKI